MRYSDCRIACCNKGKIQLGPKNSKNVLLSNCTREEEKELT